MLNLSLKILKNKKKQSTITDFGVKTYTKCRNILGFRCQNKNDLFCNIFPGTNIGKNFACGKTKCSYIVTYDLAPYFKSLLKDILSSLGCFVAMFDESYNKILKGGQMDLRVQFWDIKNNCVATRIFIQNLLGKQQLRVFMKSSINVYLSWMKTNFCRSLLMYPT